MRTIVVMAKAPLPGVAKTRLAAAPWVGVAGAARIAEAMLADTLAVVDSFTSAHRCEFVIAHAPAEARGWFASRAPRARLIVQCEGTLTPRLAQATGDAFARGTTRVVVVGVDAPQLSETDLELAFRELERREIVLGPSTDGGYWLVGLARPCAALFEAIPWSTDSVLKTTLARSHELGLEVSMLPEHFDVDLPGDLDRLESWFATSPATSAPCLRSSLSELRR